jgi:hypothetical protein
MLLDVDEVEVRARDRILALNADTERMALYRQGTVDASWREVTQLGLEPAAPAGVAHLSFHAFVEGSPNSRLLRDAAGEEGMFRSQLVVMFTYHVRSDAQIQDSRLARQAAKDVVKAINRDDADWIVEIVDAGRFMLTDTDRPSVVMRVLFNVLHEMGV